MVLLEPLNRLLLKAYPLANDPEFRSGFVTPEMEFRRIRNGAFNLLLKQQDCESQAAVDRLAELDAELKNWVATVRASEQASELIDSVNLTVSEDASAMTVQEAARLLERAGYRLIRSADDLLDAVTEVLRRVETDIGHDVAMLYGPPNRGAKEESGGSKKESSRKHLEEDALQAYIRRRLQDLLPRIIDGVDILITREDQVSRRRRFDLRRRAVSR